MSTGKQFSHNGYIIESQLFGTLGDSTTWYAKVFEDNGLLFKVKIVVSGSLRDSLAQSGVPFDFEDHGLKVIRARLDFWDFKQQEEHLHTLNLPTKSEGRTWVETKDPDFQEREADFFDKEQERIDFHLLWLLNRLKLRDKSSGADPIAVQSWAYYLRVSESAILNSLAHLLERGLVQYISNPSPIAYGEFVPASPIKITASGQEILERIETEILKTRRKFVTTDIKANARLLASKLLEAGCFNGLKMISRSELRAATTLSEEEFNEADMYLRSSRYVGATLGADGKLWLKKDGVDFALEEENKLAGGDNIYVNNSGDNAVIAAGRNSTASSYDKSIQNIFASAHELASQSSHDEYTKKDIVQTLQIAEEETRKGEGVDTDRLSSMLRQLGRMAPDILEVVVAGLVNPALVIPTVIKKIAEKAKEVSAPQ